MNGLVDEPVVRWITPGEAIKRLGLERTERELFKQLVTELPPDAVSGLVRSDGYAMNGIPQNKGGAAVEMTAYSLDSLRLYLAAAAGPQDDAGETTLRAQIVDLDTEAGLVRLHIHHRLQVPDEAGDPTFRTEDGVLLFSQIRFDERRFLSTYPGASAARPARPRQRSQPSSSGMTDGQIAIWIRSSDVTDMKNGWRLFKVSQGTQSPKKSVFEDVWREVYSQRKRGRPKKAP